MRRAESAMATKNRGKEKQGSLPCFRFSHSFRSYLTWVFVVSAVVWASLSLYLLHLGLETLLGDNGPLLLQNLNSVHNSNKDTATAVRRRRANSAVERNDTKTDLLVVVPGTGDPSRLPGLKKSLEALSLSAAANDNLSFQCLVFVWEETLVEQTKQSIPNCTVEFNTGKWTHHMLKVPQPPSAGPGGDSATHVAILVDDVDVSRVNISEFLSTMTEAGYGMASAAVPQWHYPAMHPRYECGSHRTDYADVLFVVFTVSTWQCWLAQINLEINDMGWGYDLTLATKCKVSVGVIDSAIASHKARCMLGGDCDRSYDNGIAQNQLWRWIKFATRKKSTTRAKEFHKYITVERPKQFPRCDSWSANWAERVERNGIRFRLADESYYKTVAHRGGWKSVIQYLVDTNVIHGSDQQSLSSDNINMPMTALLVDLTEKWFDWAKMGRITEPWIGITHMAMNLPPHFPAGHRLESTLVHEDFLASLPNCLGIVVLANDIKQGVEQLVSNRSIHGLNVCSLHHPMGVEDDAIPYDPEVDLEITFSNSSAAILLLGQQYRRVATIHRLQTKRPKIWLPGGDSSKRGFFNGKIRSELEVEGVQRDKAVVLKYVPSHEEYDRLIKQNIVVVDMWSATANNALMEAMALNVPVLIRKLSSTVEYVGDQYPLLFSSFEELETMLQDEWRLRDMMLRGHLYLKHMDKTRYSLKTFANELQECATMGAASWKVERA